MLIVMLAVISEGYGLSISAHVGDVACVVCKHYELLYQLVFKHVVWCVYKLEVLEVCGTSQYGRSSKSRIWTT